MKKELSKEETEAVSKIEKIYDAAKICLGGPDGGVLLDHLKEIFYGSSTTVRVDGKGSVDPLASLINEGCRTVVLYLEQLVEASPRYIEDVKKSNVQKIRAQRTGV